MKKKSKRGRRGKAIDPITVSVIRGGLTSLCTEMGMMVERTAYSPIFSEGLDYSIAAYDGKGEMVAQAAFDPCHLGAMAFAVGYSLKEIGSDNLEPGDVVMHNDPFRGGTHIHDFTIFKPVFFGKEIIAMPAIRAHQIDAGGMAPGGNTGEATEIFQEGIRIPPVKILSRGREVIDVWRLWLSNVRVPTAVHGDMRAVVGALERAGDRILYYVDKYGIETFKTCSAEIQRISENLMRKEIDMLPEGTYEYEDYMDDSGTSTDPLRIKVAITIKGSNLIADYTGSSPQSRGPINAPYAVTASNTYIGVLHALSQNWTGVPTINHGCFRPIKIVAPPGTCVNANYPSAVYGGNVEISNRLVDVVLGALGQVIPQKNMKAACYGSCHGVTCGGMNPENNQPYVWYLYKEGGWGARATRDGNTALFCAATNNKNQPMEIFEMRYPWLCEEYSLYEDSGGPGKRRGGLGTRHVLRLLAPEAELNAIADRFTRSPYSVFGGLPPKPSPCGHWNDYRFKLSGTREFKHATELFGKKSPSKWSKIVLHAGDRVEQLTVGGGGFCNPRERERHLVLDDVKNGYVSIESAKEYYGVEIGEPELLER